VSKTITISTKVKLKEYHQELQKRESEARKDKCVLLTLAIAGLIGVYALVITGVEQRRASERAPVSLDENEATVSKRAVTIGSMH